MVHASMRRIGGRAEALITSLTEAVGESGTLFVNVGAKESSMTAPFDPTVTPSDPDNGVFAEVFRTWPAVLVSNHPEGRFAAFGPLAGTLTTDVPWDDYYGAGSPLDRFLQHHGKVLRLGVDLETVTLLHYAENIVDLPNKRCVTRHPIVQTATGPQPTVVRCLDDSDGIADHPGEDYFAVIMKEFIAEGELRQGTVGGAKSELIDGQRLVDFAVRWLEQFLTAS